MLYTNPKLELLANKMDLYTLEQSSRSLLRKLFFVFFFLLGGHLITAAR